MTLNIIKELLERFFLDYGYLVIIIGIILESIIYIGLLMPGSVIAILAGFYSHQGILSLPIAITLTLLGVFIGDNISYIIGKYFWSKFTKRPLLINWINKTKKLLGKNIWKYILFSHFSANIRVFLPTIAGILKLPYKKWIVFNTIGLIIWGLVMNFLGYYISYQNERLETAYGIDTKIGWVILGIFFIWTIPMIVSGIRALIRKYIKKL